MQYAPWKFWKQSPRPETTACGDYYDEGDDILFIM